MAYAPFDPYAAGGVTRNAHFDRRFGRFCHNFDTLNFKIKGNEIPNHLVVAALPDMRALIIFDVDQDNKIQVVNGNPLTKGLNGKVEITGDPRGCNCSLTEYKQGNWWELDLSDDGSL